MTLTPRTQTALRLTTDALLCIAMAGLVGTILIDMLLLWVSS